MSHHLPDDRIKKSVDFGRSPRGLEQNADRASVQDSMAQAGEVEERAWRNEWSAEVLPNVPPKPGWHYCWVSTTNQQDPPYRRLRIGYQPVKAEELPGFEHLRAKSGEFEGCISINEMLLFKIPEDIYQSIMKEMHHTSPNREEEMLRNNIETNLTMRDSRGSPIPVEITEDGNFGPHRVPQKVPKF